MASRITRSGMLARLVPAAALVAVAVVCVAFARSATPTADPSGVAAGQAASLTAPAWITAGLAVIGAAVLALARTGSLAYRAGGIVGLSAAAGAAFGGALNLVGYANSNVWWAANPTAMRTSAGVLLIVALVAVIVVASEQLRPGWRRQAPNPGRRF